MVGGKLTMGFLFGVKQMKVYERTAFGINEGERYQQGYKFFGKETGSFIIEHSTDGHFIHPACSCKETELKSIPVMSIRIRDATISKCVKPEMVDGEISWKTVYEVHHIGEVTTLAYFTDAARQAAILLGHTNFDFVNGFIYAATEIWLGLDVTTRKEEDHAEN